MGVAFALNSTTWPICRGRPHGVTSPARCAGSMTGANETEVLRRHLCISREPAFRRLEGTRAVERSAVPVDTVSPLPKG